MAEPARKTLILDDEPEEGVVVHRWVPGADGKMVLLELPLTKELFLDPQIGDQVVQSNLHFDLTAMLCDLIRRHLSDRQDVLILGDVKHLWGNRDWRRPAPDVSVVLGVKDPARVRRSFNVVKEGVRPSLVIEVVSSSDPSARRTDLVDKVEVYQKARIPEYLLLDPPGPETAGRYQLLLYRLDGTHRYHPVKPGKAGRLLSETTGISFGIAADGQMVLLFDAKSGEQLVTSDEEARLRRAAERRASDAEAEVARLRAELARRKR